MDKVQEEGRKRVVDQNTIDFALLGLFCMVGLMLSLNFSWLNWLVFITDMRVKVTLNVHYNLLVFVKIYCTSVLCFLL